MSNHMEKIIGYGILVGGIVFAALVPLWVMLPIAITATPILLTLAFVSWRQERKYQQWLKQSPNRIKADVMAFQKGSARLL